MSSAEPGKPGKPFQPGQSGNPGGRPRGLARLTRELVGDEGESIITFWMGVMNEPKATTKERLEASRLLAERGWGKPAQFQLIEDPDPLETTQQEQDAAVERFRAEVVRLADRRPAADAADGDGSAGPTQTS